ncbi:MAG: N-acyl-D-glutamate deacylase [Lentisphaerae bacterium ADurb.Bin082]|nr:MAG: N-acyl-D-glutamate deacylase [Lentisphaerae bacterium ADurb.Bin082]
MTTLREQKSIFMTTQPTPACYAIRKAHLYDGLGGSPLMADVVVKDGVIAAVAATGSLNLTGVSIIDAEGLALAPGFIDLHSHSDRSILVAPDADGKISQGITSEIVGNCGNSAFCEKADLIREILTETGLRECWGDINAYAEAVTKRRPIVNIGALCGHNTIRSRVKGFEDKPLTTDELNQMKELLHRALEQGAAGFSSGLIYFPGKFSESSEVEALATVLRGTGKPYATHMRSEGNEVLPALEEAFRIARAGAGKLQISHIKATGPNNWGKAPTMIAMIEEQQRSGLAIKADRYPYIFSHTSLLVSVPAPFNRIEGGLLQKQLRESAEVRQNLLHTMTEKGCIRGDWDNVIIMNNDPKLRHFYGKPIATVAAALELTVPELYVKLLTEYKSGGSAAYGTMNQDAMRLFLAQDWCFPGTDASGIPSDGSLGLCHPRGFGAFPGFYKIAREMVPIQHVIRRMSADPARFFNFKNRGVIREGYAADLVLFDEEQLEGMATLENPTALSRGIHQVFVNGQLSYTREDPSFRGRNGVFLRF